ncbi:hypothetical protein Tco_0814717 [Tanacetum coccineum]
MVLIHHPCLFSLPEHLKADNTHKLDSYRICKSLPAELYEVDSGRILFVNVNTKSITLNVLQDLKDNAHELFDTKSLFMGEQQVI